VGMKVRYCRVRNNMSAAQFAMSYAEAMGQCELTQEMGCRVTGDRKGRDGVNPIGANFGGIRAVGSRATVKVVTG